MELFKQLAIRAGRAPKVAEPSLWIIGETKPAFLVIRPLLEDLIERHVRLNIILSAEDNKLRDWLDQTYPEYRIIPLPLNNPISIKKYLTSNNFRVAVVLDDVTTLSPLVISGLNKRSIALVALKAKTASSLADTPRNIDKACEICVEITGIKEKQNKINKPKHRALMVYELSDMLREMLGRDLKLRRDEKSYLINLSQKLVHLSKHPRWRHWINWRLRIYLDINELAIALNHPDTIMCLGNGPSSEHESLTKIHYDALFRVNHSWTGRKVLVHPDVVFTGGKSTMRSISGAIFGVETENAGHRLAATRFFSTAPEPIKFFNVASINHHISEFNWGHLRPTNGASMVAAAVALQPKKLIVAGIDMFQHPDGAYPGSKSTPNAYGPAHTFEAELQFIFELFDMYQGELIVVSDILREHWSRHRKGGCA